MILTKVHPEVQIWHRTKALMYLSTIFIKIDVWINSLELLLQNSNFITFFYSCFHLYDYLPYTYVSPTFFLFSSPSLSYPLSLPSLLPELPPWECHRSHSLLCCIAFARGHRETAENLCRYSRPSEKLLDLGDCLALDTYHTPNTVGNFIIYL